MDCPEEGCSGKLRVTHTNRASEAGFTQRRECNVCLKVRTSVVWLLEDDQTHGSGAAALARKVREGEESISVEVKKSSEGEALGRA